MGVVRESDMRERGVFLEPHIERNLQIQFTGV